MQSIPMYIKNCCPLIKFLHCCDKIELFKRLYFVARMKRVLTLKQQFLDQNLQQKKSEKIDSPYNFYCILICALIICQKLYVLSKTFIFMMTFKLVLFLHSKTISALLLWKCYVRPYFLYRLPIIELINKTTKKRLFMLWKRTFKKLARFPRNTPDTIIYELSDNPHKWGNYLSYTTQYKILHRKLPIPRKYQSSELKKYDKPPNITGKNLQFLPENYTEIFKHAQMKCAECIGTPHINHIHFLWHAHIDEKEIDDLLHNEFIDKEFGEKLKLNLENKIRFTNIKTTDIEFGPRTKIKKAKSVNKQIVYNQSMLCLITQLVTFIGQKKIFCFFPPFLTHKEIAIETFQFHLFLKDFQLDKHPKSIINIHSEVYYIIQKQIKQEARQQESK